MADGTPIDREKLRFAGYRFQHVPTVAWWYRRLPDSRTVSPVG